MTVNNNNLSQVGVATIGSSVGSISANIDQTMTQACSPELLSAIANIRNIVNASADLSAEEKADKLLSVDDLEREAKKAPDERNVSRVRNAISTLKAALPLVHDAYKLAAPLVSAHFGIPLS